MLLSEQVKQGKAQASAQAQLELVNEEGQQLLKSALKTLGKSDLDLPCLAPLLELQDVAALGSETSRLAPSSGWIVHGKGTGRIPQRLSRIQSYNLGVG